MREYGTNVVAGVTPGKGGQTVLGVPVFNTPQEAVKALGKIDISVLFVPAAGVKEAAISAIEAGIKLTVLVPDRVPVWDAMEIAAAAKANGAIFLGPNTLGVLSPGKGVVGMIGGRAESARQWFKPGIPKGVGVISRSGGMASSTGYYLGQAGVRISTIAHIGGDAVLGIRIPDAALMFEADPAHRSRRHLWRNWFVAGRGTGPADSRSKSHQTGDRIHRRQGGAGRHALQSRGSDY
jgi:succinyl-CoA synthetase alpha subunit